MRIRELLSAILLGGLLAFTSAPSAAEGPFFGASKVEVTSPTRGSHFYTTTSKVELGDTQWVAFTFKTGDVFSQNPNAHLHLRMDSDWAPGDKPLRGRGIVIGDTSSVSGCSEVAFELFSESNEHPGGCGYIGLDDNKEYDVRVHASKNWVAYWIYEVSYKIPPVFVGNPVQEREWTLVANEATYLPDEIPDSPLSAIAFGMAFDHNEATFSLENVKYGVF